MEYLGIALREDTHNGESGFVFSKEVDLNDIRIEVERLIKRYRLLKSQLWVEMFTTWRYQIYINRHGFIEAGMLKAGAELVDRDYKKDMPKEVKEIFFKIFNQLRRLV